MIYKSPIVFTPLIDESTIDFQRIKDFVKDALQESNLKRNQISTGAVIITGETARKENAIDVSKSLSDYLGDFVVATAGPKLEALLSGYGSGAAEMSKKLNRRVVNLDIGGGTTNISIFNCGECEQTFALDIGGRLIKFDYEGKVIYTSKRIRFLIDDLGLKISEKSKIEDLEVLCDRLAKSLLEVCFGERVSSNTKKLFISYGFTPFKADYISFSGGVGEYIGKESEDIFKHFDIGIILGKSITKEFKRYEEILLFPKEKIRATVIGAGNHSLAVSGSTIAFDKSILPLKNIPIIKPFSKEECLKDISLLGRKKLTMYEATPVSISLKGPKSPSYEEINLIGNEIIDFYKDVQGPIIVLLENDFAKALGQVINLNLEEKREVICLDKISVVNGDYIDIGIPIGNTILVVIKTLIFNS